MKFSRFTLLAALAGTTSAFVIPSSHNLATQRQQGKPAFMALEDLEAKLLGKSAPAPAPKPATQAPAPKPAPAPKQAPAPKPAPTPKPVPAPKPVPVTVAKVAPPPPVVKAVPKVVPPPPPRPASSASDDLLVVKGLALGGAPLALGALGVLAASREFLSKTAERRQQIEEKIAAQEAAQAKKASAASSVDAGGLFGAAVS